VSATRQLKALFDDPEMQARALSHIVSKWYFNPPAAPHFRGLWKAIIKSAESHIPRVVGSQVLIVEEFHTLIPRIEGIFNLRPLTPMSADPNDLYPLTSGHFLIGQPICVLPEKNITAISMNRLDRWQLFRQCYQSFWRRWTIEYLSMLQGRQKWHKQGLNLQINDIVIVEASKHPPTNWLMGRIMDIHPGKDQLVRVATVRTRNGLIIRPVVKLVKLPV
jgi:hypothetical protein